MCGPQRRAAGGRAAGGGKGGAGGAHRLDRGRLVFVRAPLQPVDEARLEAVRAASLLLLEDRAGAPGLRGRGEQQLVGAQRHALWAPAGAQLTEAVRGGAVVGDVDDVRVDGEEELPLAVRGGPAEVLVAGRDGPDLRHHAEVLDLLRSRLEARHRRDRAAQHPLDALGVLRVRAREHERHLCRAVARVDAGRPREPHSVGGVLLADDDATVLLREVHDLMDAVLRWRDYDRAGAVGRRLVRGVAEEVRDDARAGGRRLVHEGVGGGVGGGKGETVGGEVRHGRRRLCDRGRRGSVSDGVSEGEAKVTRALRLVSRPAVLLIVIFEDRHGRRRGAEGERLGVQHGEVAEGVEPVVVVRGVAERRRAPAMISRRERVLISIDGGRLQVRVPG